MLVVDTSIWIETFRGRTFSTLEIALRHGEVVIPPIVLAEILSGTHHKGGRKKLEDFFSSLPLHPVGRAHWKKVGFLRADLAAQGLAVSIPDCHVAQCTLELKGALLSGDKIFEKIAGVIPLKMAV